MWNDVEPTEVERSESRPGDQIVVGADVVMDRGFTVTGAPNDVWPWIVQLGKQRAGWYLPRRIERVLPAGRRAYRRIEPRWQGLQVGDVIPDYGGRRATFTVDDLVAPRSLVYRSERRGMQVSWSIVLRDASTGRAGVVSTRVLLRLRLGPVRRRWLAATGGELIDVATIAGLAAGLRERLAQ